VQFHLVTASLRHCVTASRSEECRKCSCFCVTHNYYNSLYMYEQQRHFSYSVTPSLLLTLSHSHTLTLSHSHTLTLSHCSYQINLNTLAAINDHARGHSLTHSAHSLTHSLSHFSSKSRPKKIMLSLQ
jgi:hypothetical protein